MALMQLCLLSLFASKIVFAKTVNNKYTYCGKKFDICLENDGIWPIEDPIHLRDNTAEKNVKARDNMKIPDEEAIPCPDNDLIDGLFQSITIKGPDDHWVTMLRRDDLAEPTVYSIVRSKMSWDDARDFCKEHGAHFAVFETRLENDIVTDFIRQHPCLQFVDRFWIGGLVDKSWEWNWAYNNGTAKKLSYRNFGGNEPNGRYRNEKCLDLLNKFDFTWNDECCGRQALFICEHKLTDPSEKPCCKMQEGYEKLSSQKSVITVDRATDPQQETVISIQDANVPNNIHV